MNAPPSYGEYLLGVLGGLFGWFATPEAAIVGIWVVVVLGLLAVIATGVHGIEEGWRFWWLVWIALPVYLFFMFTFMPWVSAAIDPTRYGGIW